MSTTTTTRYEIVRKGDGRIYVRTSGCTPDGTWFGVMMHRDYFTTDAEAHAEIARQKAAAEAARKMAEETVVYTEET